MKWYVIQYDHITHKTTLSECGERGNKNEHQSARRVVKTAHDSDIEAYTIVYKSYNKLLFN